MNWSLFLVIKYAARISQDDVESLQKHPEDSTPKSGTTSSTGPSRAALRWVPRRPGRPGWKPRLVARRVDVTSRADTLRSIDVDSLDNPKRPINWVSACQFWMVGILGLPPELLHAVKDISTGHLR